MDVFRYVMGAPQYLIGVAFVVAGTYWGFWCAVQLVRGRRSMAWATVIGKVSSREVVSRVAEGEGFAVEYSPRIRYTYVVDGTQFENSSGIHSLLEEWGSKTWAEETVRRFDSDSVDVFFDPNNPSKSVLQRGVSRSYYWMIPCCLVLIVVGLAMVEAWKVVG